MLFKVVEEVWSLPIGRREGELQRVVGVVASRESKEAGSERAKELASKYDHHNLQEDAEYPYYWGRNDGAKEVHHFVIKPAV